MKQSLKHLVNRMLGGLDLRLVNAQWGPRGFLASFAKLAERGLAPRQVVDVGAACGEWTRECLQAFPDARYLLIEPLEENQGALAALAGENPRISVWQGALGATEGTAALNVHGDQSSFLVSNENDYVSVEPARTVAVRTLDSFLGRELSEPPGLIKADVQGYELELLKGAERCLQTAEFVLLEVSFRRIYAGCPLAHEVIAYMGARGFWIHNICSYAQRPRDGELFQADVLFASENSKVFEFGGYA